MALRVITICTAWKLTTRQAHPVPNRVIRTSSRVQRNASILQEHFKALLISDAKM